MTRLKSKPGCKSNAQRQAGGDRGSGIERPRQEAMLTFALVRTWAVLHWGPAHGPACPVAAPSIANPRAPTPLQLWSR
jgi:hypothetical protein